MDRCFQTSLSQAVEALVSTFRVTCFPHPTLTTWCHSNRYSIIFWNLLKRSSSLRHHRLNNWWTVTMNYWDQAHLTRNVWYLNGQCSMRAIRQSFKLRLSLRCMRLSAHLTCTSKLRHHIEYSCQSSVVKTHVSEKCFCRQTKRKAHQSTSAMRKKEDSRA